MKNNKYVLIALLVAGCLFTDQKATLANQNLYESLSRKSSVSIFAADFKDLSKDKKIDTADLKNEVEKALSARKSIHFKIEADAAKADYVVEADILSFGWSDHDPVDKISSVASAAMDAATIEDYAFLEGNFSLKEVRSGLVVWREKLRATLTKKDMPEKDSIHLVNEDMAKEFVTTAFAKKKNR